LDALKVYALKTAPAFEAALLTGARLAGKIDALAEPLKLFSRNIGVAFQIINDLNDWQGDAHNKLSAGGDVLAGRPTVLLALALAGLSPAEQEELLSMVDRREDLSDLQRLHRVEELYRKAEVFEQARRLIDKHQQRAIEAADSVSIQPLQQLLRYLVDTVLERSEPAAPVLVDIGIKSLPITTA
jgi:geranylgeranyl diphosphate synthase, type II